MLRGLCAAAKQIRPLLSSFGFQTEAAAAVVQGPDLDTIIAYHRIESGSRQSESLRKEGKTPGTLFSFPGNYSQLISVDSNEITKLVERVRPHYLQSKLFRLELRGQDGQEPAYYTALPRTIHRNAKTDMVENVTFMYCPPDRQIEVPVPVKVIGEETSPGIKRGGYVNRIRKTIKCLGPVNSIPQYIEVDISTLDTGGRVCLDELKLPNGVIHIEKQDTSWTPADLARCLWLYLHGSPAIKGYPIVARIEVPHQPVLNLAGKRG